MKRLLVVGFLCLAAVMAVSVASASATVTVTGKCTLKGTATFSPALNVVLKEREYKFESSEVKCETTPASTSGFAKVEGKSELSCAVSFGAYEPFGLPGEPFNRGKAGTGEVKYETGGKKETDGISAFKFAGAGNKVPFKTEGTVKAIGEATFPEAALKECEAEGAHTLVFTATINEGSTL